MVENADAPSSVETPQPLQPGQTIQPGQPANSKPAPVPDIPQPPISLTEEPTAPADTLTTQAADDVPLEQTEQQLSESVPLADDSVSWLASEFIAHQKSASWYLLLVAAALVLAGLIWFLTKDKVSVAVVVFVAAVFGFYASRQPRQLQYMLDGAGLRIGDKYYSYELFRSFAVAPEGSFSSIVLSPLKRFSPLLTIYYAPEEEARIVALLAARLPMEEHKPDAIDSLMKRIRF